MDFGIISRVLGLLLLTEAACMLPSLGIALYYRQGDAKAIMLSIIITAAAGLIPVVMRSKKGMVRYKEGFMITGLGWVLASAFGALPFYFSGYFGSYINCFFEAVSGFTTTGSTIIDNVEIIPRGILFWRSFTHWLGGMGILVFAMALLPALGAGSLQIFKAETTGPTTDKLTPKIAQTAKMLYLVYIIVTTAQIVTLLIAGMPLYDSLVHTFGTVGTGGFSIYNKSIGHYNNPGIEWIITLFTFLSGVNFSLYYDALHGNFRTLLKDKEFQLYAVIVVIAVVLIVFNVNTNVFHDLGESVRHSTFQVVTIMSTTGYSTTDFNLWPDFSKMILILLMFIGSCAGSTAGGIKVIRILLVFKIIRREFYRLIHPRAVMAIRVGNRTIPEEALQGTTSFILLSLLLFIVTTMILLAQGMDMMSSTTAVAATLNNIGPGFGAVGPMTNYNKLSGLSKVLLSFCMLMGRLELHTLLVLITPNFWRR
jgi:trk system potassium uptake protein TrkH